MKPGLIQDLKSLPRAAWVLYLGTFINRFGSFVVPFQIFFLKDLGYSDAEAGLAVAAYGVGNLFAAGLGGYLADRHGRRDTTVLSMFTSAAVMLAIPAVAHALTRSALPHTATLPVMMGMIALAGMSAELYRPASTALLTDLVAKEKRVLAFVLYRYAINAGWAIGPAVAGLLASRSFVLLYVGDAITSAIYGVVALLFLPHGIRQVTHERSSWMPALRLIARDRAFQLYILSALGIGCCYFQTYSTLAIHCEDSGLTPAHYGWLHVLNGLIVVGVELPLSPWLQRHNPRFLMSAGFLLLGIGFGATAFAHSFNALLLTVVVWSMGEIISFPVSGAYVANLAPEEMRGRYMGFMGFVWASCTILGPAIGTAIYARSFFAAWMVCGAMGVFASLVMLVDPARFARQDQ